MATAATMADAGMVRNQAQTMLVATPQRTALTRLMEPTPAIAPVMTWVVETRHAHRGRHQDGDRAGGLGAEAAARAELGQPPAHGVDDPPAARERAEADGGAGGSDHPFRDVERVVQEPAGDQHSGDDAPWSSARRWCRGRSSKWPPSPAGASGSRRPSFSDVARRNSQ